MIYHNLNRRISTFLFRHHSKCSKILIIPTFYGIWQFYHIYKNKRQSTTAFNSSSIKKQQIKGNKNGQPLTALASPKKWSLATAIKNIFCHVIRFVQLFLIFTPVILLFPFRKLPLIQNFWMNLCVKSVETAGVVWIKIFQYLSHRRDVIGEQMTQKFSHLRQHAPQHSFKETQKSFKRLYGKKISQIFDEFDPVPIASGSISQVYRAKYKGQKVVVKVRHPGVENNIEKDINILFFISKLLEKFSPSFSIPITSDSMKKTLLDQINFNNEKQNLEMFNRFFSGRNLANFPRPFIEETNEQFLVQTFVQGQSVSYYQNNPHPLNAEIARLGTNILYKMFMEDNFIHADCHGGNISIDVKKKSLTFFSGIIQSLKYKFYELELYCVYKLLNNKFLKQGYCQNLKQLKKIHHMLKNCKQRVEVNIMDAGMVIKLDENDRRNFINLIKHIICHEGQKCAEMIYNLSSFKGKKLINSFEKFQNYFNQLKQLFANLEKQSLVSVKGVQILGNMLTIIRNNNMKLQGELATLLTNILMLQTMAKNLDKDINILQYAIPYFTYLQKNQKQNQCRVSPFE